MLCSCECCPLLCFCVCQGVKQWFSFEQSVNNLLLCVASPCFFPSLPFYNSAQVNAQTTSLTYKKKKPNKKEMLLVAFPPILTKIKCSQKLSWPLTPGVYWQRWLNSVVFQSAIRVFPEKLTSIWSEASWALSSALFQVKRRCGRSRKRREKELAGRGRLKQREFKVVFWARYNVLWHISDELLWFYCQTLCEPRLRTEACSCS